MPNPFDKPEEIDAQSAVEIAQAFIFHAFGIHLRDGTGVQVDDETKHEMQMLFFAGACTALTIASEALLTSAQGFEKVRAAFMEAAQLFVVEDVEQGEEVASNDPAVSADAVH